MKSVLCAIIIVCSASFVSAKNTLKYSMKKGETLHYKSVSSADISMSQGGHDMSLSSVGNGAITLQVEDATAESFTYLLSLDKFSTTISGAESIGMSDTTIEVSEVAGKRTRKVQTTYGKELSSMVVDTPHFTDPRMGMLAQGSRNMTRVLFDLPDHPVGVGDTWEVKRTDTTHTEGGDVVTGVTAKCTYVRDADTLHHTCAVVGYAITISLNGKMKQQGMDITITGDGSGKGSTYFDYKSGRMIANVSGIELNQQMALTGQQNMVMPQTTTTNTSTVLVE